MKQFDQLPQRYRSLSIALLSALTIIGTAAFVYYVMRPKPAQIETTTGANGQIAHPSDSGITVTPATPTNPYTPPPTPVAPEQVNTPSSASPQTPTSPTERVSPISPDAIARSTNPPVTSVEPYDDVITNKFNHLAYPQTDPDRIESIGLFEREGYEREEFLDYEAAAAFNQMKAAAAEDGISLIPISGFRTITRQAELFEIQVEKKGSEAAAAQLSAPPGHSEHHTGYAIDIGDANSPDADIKYAFESTPAYAWLSANAHRYGFEESFPRNNTQGVSFEPWHWRFVGSDRANEIFIYGRSLFPSN